MKTVKTSELVGQVLAPFPKGSFSALIRSGKSCAAKWRWPQWWGMGPGLLVNPVLLLSRLNSFHPISNPPGLSAAVYSVYFIQAPHSWVWPQASVLPRLRNCMWIQPALYLVSLFPFPFPFFFYNITKPQKIPRWLWGIHTAPSLPPNY